MKTITRACLAVFVLAPLSFTQASSSARDRAMGGVGVASAHPFTAMFVNPALMTRSSDDFDFGWSPIYFAAGAADEDELVDRLEFFQDTLEELQALIDGGDFVGANAKRPELAAALADLDDRSLDFDITATTSVMIPVGDWRLGLGVQNFVEGNALVRVDPNDITVINNPSSTSADLDNLMSEGVMVAAGFTEAGVSLATNVEIAGVAVALGVTPKYQQVRTFNYAIQVNQFDDDDAFDDFQDDQFRTEESGFNLDVGAAVSLGDGITAGLSVRNLISDTYQTVATNGVAFDYKVEPRATVGVAVQGAGFTLSADADLTSLEGFEGLEDTQLVRVGGEWDAWGWAQLRAGFVHDFEDGTQDLLSGGLGFSPFEILRIDLMAFAGDNAYGGGFQLALTL